MHHRLTLCMIIVQLSAAWAHCLLACFVIVWLQGQIGSLVCFPFKIILNWSSVVLIKSFQLFLLWQASSVRTATCYGSVDHSSRKTRNTDDHLAKKLIETSSRISVPAKNSEHSLDSAMTFNLADDNNRSERKILWKSLSPFGKVILRGLSDRWLIAC